jgi:hypothetical protein
MKKICLPLLFLATQLSGQMLSFTVTNVTGTNVLSCNTPSIVMNASSNFSGAVSYSWASATNTLNGSSVTITIPGVYTVTASGGNQIGSLQFTIMQFPILNYTIGTVPGGYTLGCGTKSTTTFSLISSGSPSNNPLSYSLSTGGTLVSSGSGTPISNIPISIAGPYTIQIAYQNGCTVSLPFSILANTISPVIDNITADLPYLSCKNQSMMVKAFVSQSGTSSNWPAMAGGYQVMVQYNSTLAPTNTLVNVLTFTLTETNNQCTSTATVPIYQNIYPPKVEYLANSTFGGCADAGVVLNNVSKTTIPKPHPLFPDPTGPINCTWTGPTAGAPPVPASSFTVVTPGNYTLTAIDSNNGCKSTTIISVCAGVNEINSPDVSLFPNPGANELHLLVSDGSIGESVSIYRIDGKKVLEWKLVQREDILNIENLNPGIYFLSVPGYKDSRVFKFLKAPN